MDHIAAAEEQIVSERLRRKLEEVNVAAQSQLSPIQDHINFTLQVSFIHNFRLMGMNIFTGFDPILNSPEAVTFNFFFFLASWKVRSNFCF